MTIAALPSIAGSFLPKPVSEFCTYYPNINVSIHDALAEAVQEMVREERADMGFTVKPQDNTGLNFEFIMVDKYIAICPNGHPLLKHAHLEWVNLAGYPFVGFHRSSNTRQHIESIIQGVGIELDTVCEINQIATVGRMVAAGIGISVLPALSLPQIGTLGIEWRPLVAPEVSRPLGVITRDRSTLSVAAEAFLSFVRPAYPSRRSNLAPETGPPPM